VGVESSGDVIVLGFGVDIVSVDKETLVEVGALGLGMPCFS